MNFQEKPVRQRVVFHTWAAPFANRLTYQLIQSLQKRFASQPKLAKIEGIFRFYLEGKLH